MINLNNNNENDPNTKIPTPPSSHLGFGSSSQNRRCFLSHNKILNVSLAAFSILSAALIATAAGLAVGLTVAITPLVPVGIAIGTFVFLITFGIACRAVYSKVSKHRCYYNLDKNIINANEKGSPKLGEYCKADLKVTNNVERSFENKKELVRSATQSIECSFNFAGGEKLQEFLKIIDERMVLHKNLKTHLLISNDLLMKEDRKLLKTYQEKFPGRFNFIVTNRQTKLLPIVRTEENHVKLLVVDGRYFAIGGSGIQENMTRESLPKNADLSKKTFAENFIDRSFRDTDLFGKSSTDENKNIAQSMRGQFFNLYQVWAKRMSTKLDGNEGTMYSVKPKDASCPYFDSANDVLKNQEIKFVVGGPEHRGANPIEEEMSKMISEAEKEINIGNLMFNPGKKIKNALVDVKKQKGAKVKIIGHFNGKGPESSLVHYTHVWPSRPNYRLLDEVHESQTEKQHYHKKVLTVDGKMAAIGSYNLGQKSSLCDYEAVCFIRGTGVAKSVNDALDEDKLKSKKIETGSSWRGENRFMGYITRCFLGNLAG